MSKTPGQSKQRPISAFFTPVPKTSSAKKSGTPMDAINKPGEGVGEYDSGDDESFGG